MLGKCFFVPTNQAVKFCLIYKILEPPPPYAMNSGRSVRLPSLPSRSARPLACLAAAFGPLASLKSVSFTKSFASLKIFKIEKNISKRRKHLSILLQNDLISYNICKHFKLFFCWGFTR